MQFSFSVCVICNTKWCMLLLMIQLLNKKYALPLPVLAQCAQCDPWLGRQKKVWCICSNVCSISMLSMASTCALHMKTLTNITWASSLRARYVQQAGHFTSCKGEGGDISLLVEHNRAHGTLLTQVSFPGAARDFSPRVNFQCRLCYGVHTPPCAIACIDICAQVKDLVVHVRVRWIMETENTWHAP